MKKNPIILALIFTMSFFGFGQNSSKNDFLLEVDFKGENTKFLVLNYRAFDNEIVNDTIYLTSHKSKIKGKINGGVIASFTDDKNSNTTNSISFFIEPGITKISLEENHFKDATIEGSSSQKDYENLRIREHNFYEKIDSIRSITLELRKQLKKEPDKEKQDVLEALIKTNESIWNHQLEGLEHARMEFVVENPHSYVSPYVLYFIYKRMPLDILNTYYNNLNQNVKNSYFAKRIKKGIDIRKMSATGSKAPDFSTIDVNGNTLSLEQFKGRYVLLDFWASWCAPCKEKHPELKKMYSKYNDKGLEIIGISFDKDRNAWKNGVNSEAIDIWHHIYVGMQNVSLEGSIAYNYHVQPIPAYILIDKNGFIVGRYLNAEIKGENEFSKLENKLKLLLATKN